MRVAIVTSSPIRQFTIFDAMVLIAATAMGLAWLRMLGAAGFLLRSESVISRPAYIAQCANEVAFPFLTTWVGGAQAPFDPRVGQPDGQFPSVPGHQCSPSPSSSFFDFLSASREFPTDPFPLWYIARRIHLHVIPRAHSASAIAGAWLTLLLAGWWRSERTWIDRFGRALGAGWIAVSLVYHGVSFFAP
jgi:hypothetical protein